MNKITSLLTAVMIALMIAGCATEPSSSASQNISDSSSPIAGSAADGLTDDQKNDLLEYLQSSQKVELDSAIEEANDGLSGLIQDKNTTEIDRRSLAISLAVKNAEEMEVPPICETLHYNKLQCGRALFIALADYSDAIAGGDDSKVKFDEANEYLEKATEFTNAYEDEVKRLADIAK